VPWANVPKATVNKNSHFRFPKNDVGSTVQRGLRTTVNSVAMTSAMEKLAHLDFAAGVTAALTLHAAAV
jgi:hypothetical protein